MGSNGGEDVMISGSNDAKCCEATVEIKIKTLDSQTYTLRVDKCVPVPALKEQIAIVTGVLSEQQRLICRGKVLKDDQLLSAYHVEDGHTLHLVVRQPIPPSSESFPDHPATDSVSSTVRGLGYQVGPGVVVGTFNISEQGQGDGVLPDLSRIVSAVLGSFGIANVGNGSEGVEQQEPSSESLSRTPGLGGLRNSSGQQPDQATTRGQSNTHYGAFPLPTAVPLESLQPTVIPDSLTTLSQYLSHMRQEFSANVGGQSNNSQAAVTYGSDGQDSNAASHPAVEQAGLPTPASLAEVLLSTRQILNEQAGECLSQLTRQLEDHANVTDPLARMGTQSAAVRSGALLQNLGALLLELGRTTMTLRMGLTPTDAVVNAGPAVFISPSGPNPIMVQPLPFQPGTSFGAIPVGTVQPGPGLSSGTVGYGFHPRNIDIRIRTGSLIPSSVNQREPTGERPLGQIDAEASGGGNSIYQAAAGVTRSSSSTRESEVRVVPIRTVIAAVPAALGHAPSDSSRGLVGLFSPVLERVQHDTSGNLNSTIGRATDEHRPAVVDSGRRPIPDSAVQQQNVEVPGVDGAGMQHGERFSAQLHSGLDQLLRTIFAGEHIHGGDDTSNAAGPVGTTTQNADTSQGTTPSVGDEGTFLSNLLRQIMPIVSESMSTGSDNIFAERTDVNEDRTTQASPTQAQENADRGNSSRRQNPPPSPPSSKRQKRE